MNTYLYILIHINMYIGSSVGSRQGSHKAFKLNSTSDDSKNNGLEALMSQSFEIMLPVSNTRRRSLFNNVQEGCAKILGLGLQSRKSSLVDYREVKIESSIDRLININNNVNSELEDIDDWQIPLIRIRDDYLRGNAIDDISLGNIFQIK